MGKQFRRTIPVKPFLKRKSYSIPEEYQKRYEEREIRNGDDQTILFHLTQFGGFKTRRSPNWLQEREKELEGWYSCKTEGAHISYRASPSFLETFGDIKIQPLERIWQGEVLNIEDMEECGYSQDEIEREIEFLKELNCFYSEQRIGLEIPNSGITAEDRVDLSRLHAIPFLRTKPFAGGRLFHPESSYQRMSSSLRPLMTLNEERTAEIDLSAATLQFINIALERGQKPPISPFQQLDDPYQYFIREINSRLGWTRPDWRALDREEIKKVLYTIIYSDEKKEKSNLNFRLSKMRTSMRYGDFQKMYPEFFEGIANLREISEGNPLHIPINKGESDYAKEVLKRGCLDEEIPILPIHDSFITTRDNVRNLERIMNETSIDMFGRKLKHKIKYPVSSESSLPANLEEQSVQHDQYQLSLL